NMQAVFAAPAETLQGESEQNLTAGSEKEQCNTTEDDKCARKLRFSVEECGARGQDIGNQASRDHFSGFAAIGEDALRTRKAKVIGNKRPGNRSENEKNEIGPQIKDHLKLKEISGEMAKIARD